MKASRIVSLLLALVFILALAAGCDSADSGVDTSEPVDTGSALQDQSDDTGAPDAGASGEQTIDPDEWISQFIMGMRPLSEFEDFRQYLVSFHIKEFLETYQAAYDRCNAL